MDSTKNHPLRLLKAEPSDALEILEMHMAAFTDPPEPVFFALFPPDEEREKGVKRMIDWWVNDPTATYIKVVDTETGKIVSAAKWCIRKDPPTEEQLNERIQFDWLPDADMNDWAEEVWHYLFQEQLTKWKDGKCCIIDMLSTHPDHQRRGAGSMLMKWGTDIADSLGYTAFVQGTHVGKPFYESHGFVNSVGWTTVPVAEKHKDRPSCGWFSLLRPAKTVATPVAKTAVGTAVCDSGAPVCDNWAKGVET